jgi:peptidoglycan/LPS O-acetylase OafA/YrhL
MTTAERTHRNVGIDVLRGLAVLAVVMHHTHLRFFLNHVDIGPSIPKPLARAVFWSGYYGVIVFFVISGFLITSLSLRRWGSLGRIDARAFYAMRAARIMPCLLALLAVLSLLHFAGIGDFSFDHAHVTLWRAIVAALTFHLNWLEGAHGYLPGSWDVLWSLSVEEAFYIVFPLACLALRRDALMIAPLVALIVLGPLNRIWVGDSSPWDEYAYLSCTDGIAFGCLAALVRTHVAFSRRSLAVAFVVGVAAIVLIVVMRRTTNELGLVETGLYISVLEAGVALVLIALAGGLFASMRSRIADAIAAIGRCSYEIYLTHMFVVFTAFALFRALDAGIAWVVPWYVVAMAASIALGWAVERWFSSPANAWLRARWLRRGALAREVRWAKAHPMVDVDPNS